MPIDFRTFIREDQQGYGRIHSYSGSGPSLGNYQPAADLNLRAQKEREITKSDLDQVEKYADRVFSSVGIDVEFTRHFLDRVNDQRNVKQITQSELIRLFKQSFKKYGKKIAQLGPDAEAVITDMKSDINMPFVLNLKGGELELVAKTVMRKKNFKTSGPKMSFEQFNEAPRIPRKKGQPAGSDSHSDLYTDENPKGTIQGLGFKDVATAKASVNKIESSGKAHAHKIQAAIAMEQRAKEMGKSAEAAVYRKYIEKMKQKTKEMQEKHIDDLGDMTHKKKPYNWDKYKNLINDNWRNIPVMIPPKNSSDVSKKEVLLIKKEAENRTAEENDSITKHDENATHAIEEYMKKEGLSYLPSDVDKLTAIAGGVSRHFKNMYQRPRPSAIANKLNIDIPYHSDRVQDKALTPSYPAGHSTQARLVAEYYGNIYPEHKNELIMKADESGLGRIKAGWHYPSDNIAGIKLALRMLPMINLKGEKDD